MYYVMIGNLMESGPYQTKAEAVRNCPPGRDVMNEITGALANDIGHLALDL
jgi:hypothetical protein